MTVRHILAAKGRDVVTCDVRDRLAEIVEILAGKRIGAIVATDADGAVLGIISERDVVRALAAAGADSLESRVADHMTRKVETITEDKTVEAVMEIMTRGRFRHVPVVERGRLAGLVSIGDIVKHRLAEMEHEQQALKDYIATA